MSKFPVFKLKGKAISGWIDDNKRWYSLTEAISILFEAPWLVDVKATLIQQLGEETLKIHPEHPTLTNWLISEEAIEHLKTQSDNVKLN